MAAALALEASTFVCESSSLSLPTNNMNTETDRYILVKREIQNWIVSFIKRLLKI